MFWLGKGEFDNKRTKSIEMPRNLQKFKRVEQPYDFEACRLNFKPSVQGMQIIQLFLPLHEKSCCQTLQRPFTCQEIL